MKVLTVADLAAKHKINPRNLRSLLRRHSIKPNRDGRYEWAQGDEVLSRIAYLVVNDVPAKKK